MKCSATVEGEIRSACCRAGEPTADRVPRSENARLDHSHDLVHHSSAAVQHRPARPMRLVQCEPVLCRAAGLAAGRADPGREAGHPGGRWLRSAARGFRRLQRGLARDRVGGPCDRLSVLHGHGGDVECPPRAGDGPCGGARGPRQALEAAQQRPLLLRTQHQHRPRRALGASPRNLWRGPDPDRSAGRGLRGRHAGPEPHGRAGRPQRGQALCGVQPRVELRGGRDRRPVPPELRRQRLARRPAADVPARLRGGGRRGARARHHVRVQLGQRHAALRQPPAARRAARPPRLRWRRDHRLRRHRLHDQQAQVEPLRRLARQPDGSGRRVARRGEPTGGARTRRLVSWSAHLLRTLRLSSRHRAST